MQGGINNAALFGASQREARGKLEQMAGIKRPPSGILASSPELMQAASAMPARPQPMPMPMAQPMPATMPMVQPALPQVPMQTTVAPMQQAPAPRPMAPAPQPQQQQPTMMQEGGPVDVGEAPVAEDASKSFMDYIRGAGDWMAEAIVATYGTGKAAEQAGRGKKAAIDQAVETGDEEKIVNTVLANADVPITDEGKQDFARNVFGLEDVNDIDEINRRIADVAMSSAIGKGPDEFAQAVLLGLQNYKQTASARAAGTSGGVKSANYRSAKNAYQDAFTKAMGVSDTEIPEGMTKEQYATQFAETVVRRTYTPEQIAAAGITMGSIPSGGGKSGPTLEEFLVEAQKINPDSSVEELTEFYNKRYGG